MKIFVLGGDGFCGWPTALRLSSLGHEVVIIDNLIRRKIDADLGSNSLIPISSIKERIGFASKKIGNISFIECDIFKEYSRLTEIFKNEKPEVVVHFAEQRSAPYSMISQKERRFTIDNNVSGTSNVLNAIVETDPNIHLIHLGTMGVYGYSKEMGKIPEGYLDILLPSTGEKASILYPSNPGSVYHLSKCLDQLMFQYFNKNWQICITDLHQGIVWGTETEETKLDKKLNNRFDYDGIYGTVLNRFIIQAASERPLTVYGSGGQARAFIHISDTANCINLAINNRPDNDKVQIFNQVSEVYKVKELAELVSANSKSEISFVENPRKELSENELEVANFGLISLGFEPIKLSKELVTDVSNLALQFKNNIKDEQVLSSPRW